MSDLRNVNIDEFAKFVLRDTGYNTLALAIKEMGDKYLNENIPKIAVGKNVWIIIRDGQSIHITKGQVIRIQFRKRYSFVVHYDTEGGAAYTKNSIGKTVFFTEEEALKALEKMKNAKNG